MSPAPSELDLQRMIADLAAMRESDRRAILDLLDRKEAGHIRALLDGFGGGEDVGDSAAETEIDLEMLSPWLAARIRSGEGMTNHAATILRRCAREIAISNNSTSPSPSRRAKRPRWFRFRGKAAA